MARSRQGNGVGVSGLPVDWRLLSMTAESAGLAWLIWDVATTEFWSIDPRGVLGRQAEVSEGLELASWLEELFPDDARHAVETLLVEVDERQDVSVECGLADRRVELQGVVFRDADGACYGSALIRDVTEVRAAQARLVAGEKRFRAIFDTAPVAMVLEDTAHVLVDVNPAFEKLTGRPRDALVGQRTSDIGCWSSAEEQDAIRRYLAEGAKGVVELHVRTAAGRVKQVLASITPAQLDGDTGYVLLLSDVTEHNVTRRRLLEALQGAMQEDTGVGESFMDKLEAFGGESEAVGMSDLTTREREALARMADGKDNEAIAADLDLKPSTVRNYVSGIYQKLGVTSRGEAIVWARQHGLGGE